MGSAYIYIRMFKWFNVYKYIYIYKHIVVNLIYLHPKFKNSPWVINTFIIPIIVDYSW